MPFQFCLISQLEEAISPLQPHSWFKPDITGCYSDDSQLYLTGGENEPQYSQRV